MADVAAGKDKDAKIIKGRKARRFSAGKARPKGASRRRSRRK